MEIETLTWDYLGWKNHKPVEMSEQEVSDFNSKELKEAGAVWEDGSEVLEEEIDEVIKDMGFEEIFTAEYDFENWDSQKKWNMSLETALMQAIKVLLYYAKTDAFSSYIVVQVHSEKIFEFVENYNSYKLRCFVTTLGGTLCLNKGNMHESVIKIFHEKSPGNYVALELQNIP